MRCWTWHGSTALRAHDLSSGGLPSAFLTGGRMALFGRLLLNTNDERTPTSRSLSGCNSLVLIISYGRRWPGWGEKGQDLDLPITVQRGNNTFSRISIDSDLPARAATGHSNSEPGNRLMMARSCVAGMSQRVWEWGGCVARCCASSLGHTWHRDTLCVRTQPHPPNDCFSLV
jgi:hypothetical protein